MQRSAVDCRRSNRRPHVMSLIESLETASPGTAVALDALIAAIAFDAQGLIAAITQQHDTGDVLMLGWMKMQALRATLASGEATYFSRSRQRLWRKGETSGQVQKVLSLRLDCDGDVAARRSTGAACHTGRRSCFDL